MDRFGKKLIASSLGSLGYQITKIPKELSAPLKEKSGPQEKKANKRMSKLEREFDYISKLPGFLSLDAYDLFCKLGGVYSKKSPAILEIGVFCGQSFLALGFAFRNPSRVVGVDPFYEDFKNSPALEDEGEYLENASQHLSRNQRMELLKEIIEGSRKFRPKLQERFEIKETTQEKYLKSKKASEKFDVVHIDGEHTYKAIYDFMNELDEVLNPGALIIVDDFLNPGFPGISEGVHTHQTYKHTVLPLIYAFNKAVFLYKPAKDQIKKLKKLLVNDYRVDGRIIRPFEDGSIVVQ